MTITPIETRYAGCRFRSRLEARWAVFFNYLEIPWEYEPEGYMVGPDNDQRPYLPDFWLPSVRQWVEVKGAPPALEERLRITHAVVTHPDWGLPNNGNGLMLLGNIPHVLHGILALHPVMTFHKGDLIREYSSWDDAGRINHWRLDMWNIVHGVDGGGYELHGCKNIHSEWHSGFNPAPFLWDTASTGILPPAGRRIREAYDIARSARFEHGEHG